MSIASCPENNDLIQAALGYAARGWRVVPVHTVNDDGSCSCGNPHCTNQGKHPIQADWPKQATIETSVIEAYWREASLANVGIATGSASGIFVVDLDGPEGIEGLKAIATQYGGLPPTYTVVTGSGGRHLYFVCPRDRIIGNRAKINDQPIDVRGEGGQVLAPPSLHRSGRRYFVENDIEPADAPEWLLDLVAPAPVDGKMATGQSPPSPPATMTLFVGAGGADLPSRVRALISRNAPRRSQVKGDIIKRFRSPTLSFMGSG